MTIAELEGRSLIALSDILASADLPQGVIEASEGIKEVLDRVLVAEASAETISNGFRFGITAVVADELVLGIPGLDAVKLVIGGFGGATVLRIEAAFSGTPESAAFRIAIEDVPLTLRVDSDILRPLVGASDDPDPDAESLDVVVGDVTLEITEAGVNLGFDADLKIPRCMIGSSGIILTVDQARWIAPGADDLPANTPDNFTGLFLDGAKVEFAALGIGDVSMDDVFIGTSGFSGKVMWSDDDLTWNPAGGANGDGAFEGVLAVELAGFDGGLSKFEVEFRQNALVGCAIAGCIYAPYIERVIGLDIGLDGNGAFTAIAQPPTCKFPPGSTAGAGAPNSGYILSADIENVFKFDVSRVEVHVGGGAPASLALSGRVKLSLESFELPAVEFKGLSIDEKGHVAIEGGWLDVDQAKSGPLSGFPIQITRIGFGVEKNGYAWIGLNGGIKLHDILPVGASIEGLKVSWKANAPTLFSLEGIGVELAVEGTFSFVGKAAFFKTEEASGFRATIKLSLDSVGLAIDVGMMVGRMTDGTFFFYLYIGVDLPVGIPLFSTGAAIYGFAGLLAVNLQPARQGDEHWYYGYYKRSPVGVTPPEKWAVKRDAFAVGVGTTIGSMPDTGYAINAKVLLILSLPGPRILLTGKGSFIEKKPDNNAQGKEGTFEALLVLDTPAKLFQANLAITFKMGTLLEIGGGIDAAFSWSDQPPADVWHVYAGEKEPPERRVRAKLLDLLKGDTWLMINRAHYFKSSDALTKERIGDFEIGGSVSLGVDYDFSVVKVWLKLSIFGQAAITWEPQTFFAEVELLGTAGIAALGMEIMAALSAKAMAKASKPWYFGASIEVEVRVNLIFFKWEFHERLTVEYTQPEVPDYVHGFVEIKADHNKASEARELAGAKVPPDTRPVIVFSKPVRDLPWFNAPGDPNLPPEDLHVREVSYQLRHIVLVRQDGGNWRLVGAAGQATVNGTGVSFAGLDAVNDRLPDLAGASITLFAVGDATGHTFSVVNGGGASATLAGNAPQGTLCYRLTAPQARGNVSIVSTSAAGFGQVEATLTQPLATPERYRGGTLTSGSKSWRIMDAAALTLRLQADDGVAPAAAPAVANGPTPSRLEGMWAPTGDPVDEPGSSTRLQVWARTPFAMFRYNQAETIDGLDAFKPDYACGPTPSEEPVCTKFEDVTIGPLPATFRTAGIRVAMAGTASAAAAAAPKARTLLISDATFTFTFDPLVDAVWVTAEQHEFGVIRVYKDGAQVTQLPIDRAPKRLRFAGGVDRVEISGIQVQVHEICFTPGWTCVEFDAANFPQNTTNEISYAGLLLGTTASVSVTDGVLHVVPKSTIAPPRRGRRPDVSPAVRRIATATGDEMAIVPIAGLEEAFIGTHPILGDVQFVPGLEQLGSDAEGRVAMLSLDQPRPDLSRRVLDRQIVWRGPTTAPLVTLAIEFQRPVTRARVALGGRPANVVALAGTMQAAIGTGRAGETVSLFADPAGPSHIGWFNRLVITAANEIEVREICTDRGDFGWERYEQWTWRQGIRRSVEWLYDEEPILSPGDYELRAHTAAVVTGEQPTSELFSTRAAFAVGSPAGLPEKLAAPNPPDADPRAWNYPYGGPLTSLATYVKHTMPEAGARLWYRKLDTAVAFNENYVTRMFIEANHELQVDVINASDVPLRSATRHVWARGGADLDATTSRYVRTLVGDGTDPCATVSVAQIVGPEQVTAGAGELLDGSSLHRSQLRSRTSAAVLDRFEFTTSRFALLSHLCATFDGLCRRRLPIAQTMAWTPSAKAQARLDSLAVLESQRQQAKSAIGALQGATVNDAQILAAEAAPSTLADARRATAEAAAVEFDEMWTKCFGNVPQPSAPESLRMSAMLVGSPAASDVLVLESPEPIAWDRVRASIAPAANIPLQRTDVTIGPDFGRPDLGFDVEYGGLRWRAGTELWVSDGALRARASDPLDVTILLSRSSSIDLLVDNAGTAVQVTCDPASAQVTETPTGAPNRSTVAVRASAGTFLNTVRVRGAGVGIISCAVTTPFRPSALAGGVRIVDAKLPATSAALDHEITVMAMAPVSLKDWSVRWIDARTPGDAEPYAVCSANLELAEAQRVRLLPGVASGTATDDALVLPGGSGNTPPVSGAVFQLFDPAGRLVHERAAMAAAATASTALVIIPSADGTRAFLIPPPSANALTEGMWTLSLTLSGDVDAADLDRWTIAGRTVTDVARLPILIEAS